MGINGEIPLDVRRRRALGGDERPPTARRLFLETWAAYGPRLYRLLYSAYQAGRGEATVTLRASVRRGARNHRSGIDDVIRIHVDLRVAALAESEVLLKHFERARTLEELALVRLRASGLKRRS